MRYIRYAFLGTLGAVLVAVALANRDIVTLTLLPQALGDLIGVNMSISLPLFVVIFGALCKTRSRSRKILCKCRYSDHVAYVEGNLLDRKRSPPTLSHGLVIVDIPR